MRENILNPYKILIPCTLTMTLTLIKIQLIKILIDKLLGTIYRSAQQLTAIYRSALYFYSARGLWNNSTAEYFYAVQLIMDHSTHSTQLCHHMVVHELSTFAYWSESKLAC